MMVKKTFLRQNVRRNEEESEERAEIHQRQIVKAVRAGDVQQVRRLLLKVPRARSWHFDGLSGESLPLLHLAAREGQLGICKELVEKFSLSVNALSPLGMTALWCAVDRHCNADDASLVDFLVRAGADVDGVSHIPAGGQTTPLFQAILLGQKDDVACLLGHGANPFSSGVSAVDAARENDPVGCGEIYRMVEKYTNDYLRARVKAATTLPRVTLFPKMRPRRP